MLWDEGNGHGERSCSPVFSRGPEKTVLEFGNSFVDVLTAKVRVAFPFENPKCVENELLANISVSSACITKVSVCACACLCVYGFVCFWLCGITCILKRDHLYPKSDK